MFGRFFKNKEDGKTGPPGHQRQGVTPAPAVRSAHSIFALLTADLNMHKLLCIT
ncbi:uncharacterized protein PHALS_01344 [Plasmopara halstedii]|uniref:Uncharacterized protein n=1 Tax=Plasmopara halstedii TaxID=4781 RepID=A0A0P1A6K0_PLAHL|nr:uncharacterized protein PHALS_01344 [Plasmopara halstedii]CEG36244.1 hypothetical protein PHALS_01344 [Plasmopara halstedii]|eukprot:XP_024572613.1 hypothetical protein PHALS_01344 [Plasmopara halstedii]